MFTTTSNVIGPPVHPAEFAGSNTEYTTVIGEVVTLVKTSLIVSTPLVTGSVIHVTLALVQLILPVTLEVKV